MIVNKTVLTGSPGEVRDKLREACREMPPYELEAGTRLRALAVSLAGRENLRVTVAVYDRCSMELHVSLSSQPSVGPVVLSRNKSGGHCQIAYERWECINDRADIDRLAGIVSEMLSIGSRATDHDINPEKGGE
jgi:hypothetical protein